MSKDNGEDNRESRRYLKSKRFRNLVKIPGRSRFWIYRRWSDEKGKEFHYSTKEETDERKANAIGERAFHDWLGQPVAEGKPALIRDAIRILLQEIEARTPDQEGGSEATKRSARSWFGKLDRLAGTVRLDKFDDTRWQSLWPDLRAQGVNKLFNAHKHANMLLVQGFKRGWIPSKPVLTLPDPEPRKREYLNHDAVRLIRRAARAQKRSSIWFLCVWMWKMGGRPGEVLQYRWDMIRWNEGEHGKIYIPAAITKTRRARAIPLNSRIARLLRLRFRAMGRPPAQASRARLWRGRSEWIFPSSHCPGKPIRGYQKAWDAIQEVTGVTETIYALRDTCITNMLKSGAPETFVAKYTDTSPEMIRRIYAKDENEAMQGVAG